MNRKIFNKKNNLKKDSIWTIIFNVLRIFIGNNGNIFLPIT